MQLNKVSNKLPPKARIFCGLNTVGSKYDKVAEPIEKTAKEVKRHIKVNLSVMKELYESGMSGEAIGKHFGISQTKVFYTISKQIKAGYFERRDPIHANRFVIDDNEFIAAYEANYSQEQLRTKFKCGSTKVQSYIARLIASGKMVKRKKRSGKNVQF